MGAKVQTTQTDLLNPQQRALMASMMTGSSNLMQGIQLGQSWGGPGSSSRQGYGGTPWGSKPVSDAPGQSVLPVQTGRPGAPPASPAGMAPIPSSSGFPATNPGNPGAATYNPWGVAAYSDRNQLVSPIVNPFRRNLGG